MQPKDIRGEMDPAKMQDRRTTRDSWLAREIM